MNSAPRSALATIPRLTSYAPAAAGAAAGADAGPADEAARPAGSRSVQALTPGEARAKRPREDTAGDAPPRRPDDRKAMLSLRPDALLEIPPAERTEGQYRTYFMTGGTLDLIHSDDRTESVCDMALAQDPRAFEHVPKDLRTAQQSLNTVRRDGAMLTHVPAGRLDADSPIRVALCDAAFASPRAPRVRCVPPDLLTPERCEAALARMPLDFRDVPEGMRTEAMCVAGILAAARMGVAPDKDAIPRRLRGVAVAEALVACDPTGDHLGTVPEPDWFLREAHDSDKLQRYLRHREPIAYLTHRGDVFTPVQVVEIISNASKPLVSAYDYQPLVGLVAFMQRAARSAGIARDQPVADPTQPGTHALRNLSEHEIWRWAIRMAPGQFDEAPAQVRAEVESARSAIQHQPRQVTSVPVETLLAHPDLIDLAMKSTDRSASPLASLPDAIWQRMDRARLQALCADVLRRDRHALATIVQRAPQLMTDDLYALAAYGGNDLSLFPERLHASLREQAVRSNGDNLQHVPDEHRSLALCRLAVASKPSALAHVPARHLRQGLVAMALAVDPELLGWVVKRFGARMPDALYLRAVTQWGAAPEDLPKRLLSADLYRVEVQRHPQHIQDLPCRRDDWRSALILQLLAEDPQHITWLGDGRCKVAWAAHAYRHGASLDTVAGAMLHIYSEPHEQALTMQELMAAIQGMPYFPGVGFHAADEADEDAYEQADAPVAPGLTLAMGGLR